MILLARWECRCGKKHEESYFLGPPVAGSPPPGWYELRGDRVLGADRYACSVECLLAAVARIATGVAERDSRAEAR